MTPLLWSTGETNQKKISKYVNVTIELHGIEESIGLLKKAAGTLSKTMENLEKQDKQINSKDLEQIERIANQMNLLTSRIDKTLNDAGGYLEQAKDPTVELVSEIINETKVKAVDPILKSIQNTVSESVSKIQWALMILGFVLFLVVGLAGVLMFKFFKLSNSFTMTLKEAFEQGEFIYRKKDKKEKNDVNKKSIVTSTNTKSKVATPSKVKPKIKVTTKKK